jgi:threonine synthase
MSWVGIVERYRAELDVADDVKPVTLLEGNTPLLEAPAISDRIGANVFLKYEGLNPTGSFKDRGMTMAVTMAVAQGSQAIVCASTGNTSASAAAYAARAGIKCLVLIPEGYIAMGKLAQALMHGADVVQIRGNFDDALEIVQSLGRDGALTVVNSVNPHRITGQKSAAFEVVDTLGAAPDVQCMPVGNAGNITAYWRGYKQAAADGHTANLPKMLGFQAAGAAPLVHGNPIADPETIATAIRIGKPASWQGAVEATSESNGSITAVTDEEIVEAYHLVAKHVGVFCEPASAASIAGLLKSKSSITPDSTVVCVLTGHGLKDPALAVSESPEPVVLDADEKSIRSYLDM